MHIKVSWPFWSRVLPKLFKSLLQIWSIDNTFKATCGSTKVKLYQCFICENAFTQAS